MNNQLADTFVEIPQEPKGLWYLIIEHSVSLGFPALFSSRRESCHNFINFMQGTFRRVPDREGIPSRCSRISLDEFFSLTPEPSKKSTTSELTEEQEASVRAILGE